MQHVVEARSFAVPLQIFITGALFPVSDWEYHWEGCCLSYSRQSRLNPISRFHLETRFYKGFGLSWHVWAKLRAPTDLTG